MKILGKIALIFTGCFLLFAVIGNIALSFNGGVKASFQQVYDRLRRFGLMNCSAGRRNLWTRLRIVWIRPRKRRTALPAAAAPAAAAVMAPAAPRIL